MTVYLDLADFVGNAEKLVLGVAAGELEQSAIADWLRARLAPAV